MKDIKSQRGFILLVAIIACAILAALGVLVFSLSTGDLRTSVATLGQKKALGAAESGYHILTQTFDPMANHYGLDPCYKDPASVIYPWCKVDATNDPGSRYTITNVALSSKYLALPAPGSSMDPSQAWGMARYDITVMGDNSSYKTNAQVDIGVGYGPVSTSLIYK